VISEGQVARQSGFDCELFTRFQTQLRWTVDLAALVLINDDYGRNGRWFFRWATVHRPQQRRPTFRRYLVSLTKTVIVLSVDSRVFILERVC
jgi:hypothetical protein